MQIGQPNLLTNRVPTRPQVISWLNWRWLVLMAGLVGLGFLSLYNLAYHPAIWFDEGEHLRVAKTLVQQGRYAVWSADGFRYFGPTIGVGPTVLLPIALSFELFGVGLVQARLVIVAYLFVAIGLYWLCGRRLLGSGWLASLSVALLCAAPGLDVIQLGRQGLGEIPALAFFLAGWLAWLRAVDNPSGPGWRWLGLAGGLWALAAITKSNYGLLLPPALALVWLSNAFYYRQPGFNWRSFALPIGLIISGLVGWYAVVLVWLGDGDIGTNLKLLGNASGGSAFVFAPARMLSAIKYIFSLDGLFGLAIPGLTYGLWLCRSRSAIGFRLALPVAFGLVWLGWFGLASIGWPRYAFPGLVICPLLVAKLVADLPRLVASWWRRPGWQAGLTRLIGLLVAGLLIAGFGSQMVSSTQSDSSAQQLTAYLNQQVSPTALIETWESELGFLTDHRYHYPPPEMLDKAVRRKWLNANLPPLDQLYRPEALEPDYLINGQFGQWNELYPETLLSRRYELLTSFGSYKVYRRLK